MSSAQSDIEHRSSVPFLLSLILFSSHPSSIPSPMSPSWATADLGVLVPGDPPTKLYYLDSHPVPPEGPYTTLVAVHGTGFNSRIWLPLLPHLPPHTRLLAFNRRGYAGSSPPHVSASPGAGNTEGFGRQVLDLAAFVRFAVEGLGVPAAAQGEGKGGIVLFGWCVL
ncbi:hypothetical protein CALCODRAFT_232268 [Calocera cornea HHB12733]|uniref:AB hydrolase-1 domain-containing protein n=1 Tax=Calocera cornea HHB12733 TaxID=1353952 RepID=A0A165H0E5_9BASI|nr:hypothetical protein CALCODRAFT_232268 [Calocera cornea HHB12733]